MRFLDIKTLLIMININQCSECCTLCAAVSDVDVVVAI